jgi:ribosomal protein L16/L10AE
MLKKTPNNYKYKKIHKNKIKIKKKNKIQSVTFRFGTYGIKALENGRLTYNQIEATRKIISKKIKKISKI